ncbi:MAG: hypothetical protein MSG64_07155 [Pyrinomonadaceae bacterium MAG19_C2-C3]|nr:hypothetical protein [Pyrinomonadaceae bacterium MAG19_C2-C3]
MNEQDTTRLARNLAHRIAQQLDAPADAHHTDDTPNDELARLRANVAELNQRLAKIESRDTTSQTRPLPTASPALSARSNAPTFDHDPAQIGTGGTYVSAVHPSGQRFGIGEAVSELVDYFEQSTKTCELEPGNKPCDHCAMCSSRGF